MLVSCQVGMTVGTQEDGYTKGGILTKINPIWQVTPSSIFLAKLGRAVTASTWQQKEQKDAHQLIHAAGYPTIDSWWRASPHNELEPPYMHLV